MREWSLIAETGESFESATIAKRLSTARSRSLADGGRHAFLAVVYADRHAFLAVVHVHASGSPPPSLTGSGGFLAVVSTQAAFRLRPTFITYLTRNGTCR